MLLTKFFIKTENLITKYVYSPTNKYNEKILFETSKTNPIQELMDNDRNVWLYSKSERVSLYFLTRWKSYGNQSSTPDFLLWH